LAFIEILGCPERLLVDWAIAETPPDEPIIRGSPLPVILPGRLGSMPILTTACRFVGTAGYFSSGATLGYIPVSYS
jgi:hypothetical protein